jgi:SAM-dependent methyltransferase/glycosyltransferase involved in cell wall biosynthesis
MSTAPSPLVSPGLLGRIPLGVRLVLEIGCGAGVVGAALRRRDPGARLVGTEADPALAAAARAHLDEVHEIPPGETPPLPPGGADVILLHDLPARHADPAGLLRRMAGLLAPQGVIVAALPNAEHWTIARRLFTGPGEDKAAWPDAGPPPMGQAAFRALLDDAGLVPVDMAGEVRDQAGARRFAEQAAPLLSALGVPAEAWLRRAAPERHVWRAMATAPEPLVLVARTLKPVGGVNDVRIDLPMAALTTRPGVGVRVAQMPDLPQLGAGTPRIMILQRLLLDNPQAPLFVQHYRSRGWVVVQEFDDDPDHWPVIKGSGYFAFRGVHAVQTSTPALHRLFSEWAEEIAVFPNTVAELPDPANFTDPSRLTLFLGALRREEDMAPFIPALNRVLRDAGDRLAVEVIFDKATHAALATPHKRFHPILPYAEYRALMARCEIAFLPLAPTRFNGFKSDLKFVEAGAHRLACIASPTVYAETIEDGRNGLVAHGPDAFEAALRGLLAEPARARAMGEAARAWVRANRMLAGQVEARLEWYRSLWARRADLDAAMLRRAPEYAKAGLA